MSYINDVPHWEYVRVDRGQSELQWWVGWILQWMDIGDAACGVLS